MKSLLILLDIYLIIAITVFLVSVSFIAYQSYQHHKRFEAQKSEIEKKINDLFKD